MARSNRKTRHPGFTLIEVLMVLVILVILGSFAVTIFTGTQEKAKLDQARTQVGLVDSAARLYRLNMNEYPQTLEDLVTAPANVENTAKWAGPYLQKRVPLDPWNNEYLFVAPGKHNPQGFDVWSAGPDGVDGTEDDIGNWEE